MSMRLRLNMHKAAISSLDANYLILQRLQTKEEEIKKGRKPFLEIRDHDNKMRSEFTGIVLNNKRSEFLHGVLDKVSS